VIVGHEQVLADLERDLPPAVLVAGPAGTGKHTLALEVARRHAQYDPDIARPAVLTAEVARELRDFSSRAPVGDVRIIVARLDGVSLAALSVLLKVVEEPPPTVRWLLTCSGYVLPTIRSRCVLYRTGLLTDDEVAQVLIAQGMGEQHARRIAPLGRGRVAAAVAASARDKGRPAVLAALRALSARDGSLLEQALRSWGPNEAELLECWLSEAASGRWRLFGAQEAGAVSAEVRLARRMLARVSEFEGRPKLAAQVMLGEALDALAR
jgi:DNA polymerase III, delta subunit